MDEQDFQEDVKRLLETIGDVDEEVYLDSGRVLDFAVDVGGLVTLAVEVEHHPEDVVDDAIHGAGQAVEYAGELSMQRGEYVQPAVIVNDDALDVDAREVRALRRRVSVVAV